MILGLIEHDRGNMNRASLEMLTVARGIAEELDEALEAVIIGEDGRDLADGLGDYGVETVHLITHELLTSYAPEAWGRCLAQLAEEEEPEAIVAIGTERGNEIMAHVAAVMNQPMAANCTVVETGDTFSVTRVRWGGSLLEDATLEGEPKLLTIAAHIVEASPANEPEDADITSFEPELSDKDVRVRVTSRIDSAGDKVSLAEAKVVVGGGRGVGSSEGFGSLEVLAGQLGGAVGCSRAVTNKGWRSHADQVGQTGARIAPDLYIACGISGAIQHIVGCKGAKQILVINTDPEAPIIAKADYAVIGDLHEVVPAISEALNAR